MKIEVLRLWLDANRRSIVEEGKNCLQLSADESFFIDTALEVAHELVTIPNMFIFLQRFWPRYFNMLKHHERPDPLLAICEEKGGSLVAVFISFEKATPEELTEKAA